MVVLDVHVAGLANSRGIEAGCGIDRSGITGFSVSEAHNSTGSNIAVQASENDQQQLYRHSLSRTVEEPDEIQTA